MNNNIRMLLVVLMSVVSMSAAMVSFTDSAKASTCLECHYSSSHGAGHGVAVGCEQCHVPHKANLGDAAALPIWARSLRSSGFFTPYDQNKLENAIGLPEGTSLACLSCHDGSVSGHNGDSDLGATHPLSVVYDPSKPKYAAVTAVKAAGLKLFSGSRSSYQVECATCHNVHKRNAVSDANFLRLNKDVLCTTCHTL